MDINGLKIVLSKLGVDTSNLHIRKGRVKIPCPLAKWLHASGTDNNPSMSLKIGVSESTVFKCFACKEKGKLWSLVDSYAHFSNDPEMKKYALHILEHDQPRLSEKFSDLETEFQGWIKQLEPEHLAVIPDHILRKFIPAKFAPELQDYLTTRGVTPALADEFDIRYHEEWRRAVFPVRRPNGDLVGAVGRTMVNHEKKYFNYFEFRTGMTLGGLYHCANDCTKILVVEGYFDLLRLWPWAKARKIGVVCTWTAEVSEEQARLLLARDVPIQIWYDGDLAGAKGWSVAQKRLAGKTLLKRVMLPLGKDPGELTEKEFEECLDIPMFA